MSEAVGARTPRRRHWFGRVREEHVRLALAARTGLPVIHLDLSFWKPGWVAPSETEWREKQRDVLAGDTWIADGNYHETLDLRLERADTVVVLDMPWWRCSAPRSFAASECRASCPKGATTRPGPGCAMSGVWPPGSGGSAAQNRRGNARPSRSKRHVAVHVLRSKRAVDDFLDGFGADRRAADEGRSSA